MVISLEKIKPLERKNAPSRAKNQNNSCSVKIRSFHDVKQEVKFPATTVQLQSEEFYFLN